MLAAVATGCGARKRKASETPGAETASTSAALLRQLDGSALEYKTLALKGRADFAYEGGGQKFNYRIHLYKDSLIWFSASLFGIEGVRALVTPDSVFMVNRLERRYGAWSLAWLEDQTGMKLSVSDAQQLLLGEAPRGMLPADPNVELRENSARLAFERDSAEHEWTIDNALFRLLKINARHLSKPLRAEFRYESYEQAEGKVIPFRTFVTARIPEENALSLEHKDAQFNPERISFAFRAPSGYEKME